MQPGHGELDQVKKLQSKRLCTWARCPSWIPTCRWAARSKTGQGVQVLQGQLWLSQILLLMGQGRSAVQSLSDSSKV